VPLSEHEQRLLDQIERALYAEDPKFASSVRARDLRTHYRRRILRSSILFVFGLLLLLAGVIKFVALGVLGFVVMLIATLVGLTSWQRLASGNRDLHRAAPAAGPRPSIKERLEERWRRRWEDRGR
jgi:hypothetical protein